jgi:ATP-dependent DNA helicase RecG
MGNGEWYTREWFAPSGCSGYNHPIMTTGKAFHHLERILTLEAEQGYRNRSVVGGIRQFAGYWVGQARAESADDADLFFIEQAAETLSGYDRLSGPNARANAVTLLLQKLAERGKRMGRPVPTDSPQPPQPPATPQKPEVQPNTPPAPSAEKAPPPPAPAPAPKPQRPPRTARPSADPDALTQPLTTIKGVGPRVAELLEKLGVATVGELLHLYPRRYDDYSTLLPINRLVYGEIVTAIGTVWRVQARRTRTNSVTVHAVVGDGSGTVQVTWFNQPWLVNQIRSGMQIVLSGKVEQYLGRPVFNNPEWEELSDDLLRTNRIVPVYPLTKGLSANKLRQITKQTVEHWAPRVSDPLPEAVRTRRDLLRLPDALHHIHYPRNQELLHQARRRLMFDELFLLQLGMLGQRRNWQQTPAHPLRIHPGELIAFWNSLPFEPTKAQRRVVDEISADMKRRVPMNRLLQGDVGAGKTVVAAAAILAAVKGGGGGQAALMAPTEILAEQHAAGLAPLLEARGVRVRLLTGSTTGAERARVYAEAANGSADLLVGTTALIQPDLQFRNLGLVVIDEQHRFGVDQRGALRDKSAPGHHPHLLVMTATPIPRSLALTLYGDLDLSILDEMPPGRQEITTRWLRPSQRERAFSFMRQQVAEGRQVYIIYPLVEESEKLDEVKAAVAEHARLQKEIFPDLRLGLLHGRMSGSEKDAVMRTFKQHESDILISTTVIEVGIDVPNATVILIEDANRFGLAQLHQLRGRVGRGSHKSWCLLVADENSAQARDRLQALEDSNDGFVLSEKDLELRGPGDFFGRRQSGLPELKLGSLLETDLLEMARTEALALCERDPDLQHPDHQPLRQLVARFWEAAGDVS